MRRRIFMVLSVASAVILLAGSLFLRVQSSNSNPWAGSTPIFQSAPANPEEPDSGLPKPRAAPAGFGEYHSVMYHFSLLYPQDLKPQEYKEPGTAMTVVFGQPFSDKGFQVFVVPYGEKKITQERFKVDVPSGVMASSTNVSLDGVAATSFYSSNQTMGGTYEIWFIHHGFLYEVTTYSEFDAWLNQVMQSWKFL